MQSLDIYSRLCDLCGWRLPAGIEWHSLKLLLDDFTGKRDWPAFGGAGHAQNLGVAVRTARYRHAEWAGGQNGAMLFELAADPNETKNLIEDLKVAAIRAKLTTLARKHAAGGTR